MTSPSRLLLLLALSAIGWTLWQRWRDGRRRAFIDSYCFAPHLSAEVASTYPHLNEAALRDVERGLRQFFRVSLAARGKMVGMPSKVVDELWHALILDTARYQYFCRRAFGRLLHHTPARVMRAQAPNAEPLRRAWRLACRDQGLAPRAATALPLLFALDTELAIADGFRYQPDCDKAQAGTWCGNALGCGSSGCSSDDAASSADGGSDGGGGDGCGGGGCGGGGD